MDSLLKNVLTLTCKLRLEHTRITSGELKETIMQLIKEIREHYASTLQTQETNDLIYCILTAIDEAALSNALIRSDWIQASLIKEYFHDTWGGEKYYQLLDTLFEKQSLDTQDIKKFLYCLTALGYSGKYQIESERIHYQELLYQKITPSIQTNKESNTLTYTTCHPYKKTTLIMALIILGHYLLSNIMIYKISQSFLHSLIGAKLR